MTISIPKSRFLNSICLFCCTVLCIHYSFGNLNKMASHYTIKATINTQTQSLNANVTISYNPHEQTKTLAFIAHENVVIKNCLASGLLGFSEEKKSNKQKSILLNFKNTIEKPITITFDYTFTLKEKDAPWGIDKISDDWIELSLNSGWLPIISSYNNQFSVEAELDIISKSKFDILSSGTSKALGNHKYKIKNTIPQIDFVLIGSPKLHKSQKGNITIYEPKENNEREGFVFNFSEKSYQWLNSTFGEVKKIPPVKLVITPRKESGYARKNFIVLSNDISVTDTLHFVNYITHEFVHFWSNGANPLSEHRWLDESIAEYVAWKYIHKNYDEIEVKNFLTKIKKELDRIAPVYVKGKTDIPSHAVMYKKGVYKLFQLEEMVGENKMFKILIDWFRVENKNSEEFLRLIENIVGRKVVQNFRLELSK